MMNTPVQRKIFFSLLGMFAALAALLLWRFDIDALLPEKAGPYRELLLEGIRLVCGALAAASVLAFACAALWRIEALPGPEPKAREHYWQGWITLLLLAATLRVMQLNASFWWDELTGMLRYIHRGYGVILTFSGWCNNHVLMTLMSKLSISLFGEGEWQMRLPMFLAGSLAAPLACGLLRRPLGRRAAGWTGLVIALHISWVVISSEARGYAGATLCVLLACGVFARLMERVTRGRLLAYLIVCVAGYGFIINFILVPLAHGVIAGCGWLKKAIQAPRQTLAPEPLSPVLIALWSGVACLVLWGIQFPQQLDYAHSTDAARDHFSLSLQFLPQVFQYVGGVRWWPAGVVLVLLSTAGWLWHRPPRAWSWAFAGPLLALAGFLLLPDARVSMRLFFMALPAFVIGMGCLLSRLPRPIAVGCLAVWLGFAFPVYKDYIRIGNADLRGLSAALQGQRVITYGQMADVNAYYFREAFVQRHRPVTEAEWDRLRNAEVIVRGTNADKALDQDLVDLGFEVVDTLPTWRDRHPIFRIWKPVQSE